MKILSWLILALFLGHSSYAQHISTADYKNLQTQEDSIKKYAFTVLQAEKAGERVTADSIFTRMFVRALKTNNSFYYPFDSLQTISNLYPPDSSFRIFTWQLLLNEKVRQHGAIQMKTNDGSLKLFPLIDKSDITEDMEDTIATNLGWMGAVYYKIIQKEYGGHNYYTLLGFDENNLRTDKKMIEVLSFVNDMPLFGGRYFSVPNDNLKPKNPARYIMEYKKEAGPRLTYDNDLQMIVVEHLVSESNQPNKKVTLVGDGDYDGFKWANGRWVFVNKIFNEVTPEGNAPVPSPLSPDRGIMQTDENGAAKPPAAEKTKSKKKS